MTRCILLTAKKGVLKINGIRLATRGSRTGRSTGPRRNRQELWIGMS